MTNEELKKKIVEIIQSVDFYDGLLYRYCIDIATADKLADALIAAGYGNVEEVEHRAEVAEKAFLILWNECKEKLGWNIDCTMWYAKQTEKELAEGKKDE